MLLVVMTLKKFIYQMIFFPYRTSYWKKKTWFIEEEAISWDGMEWLLVKIQSFSECVHMDGYEWYLTI